MLKGKEKKYKIFVPDLVQRDFHGRRVNAKATDVSYIRADESQNFVYLSATIDHKTKYVHWSMSKFHGMKLIMDTQKHINEKDYVLHSDHAWQYFQPELLNFNKYMNIKSSMKTTNYPLDNREIECFFGCLKSECLHHEKTHKMKFHEIKQLVSEYINWYNIKRRKKDCIEKHQPKLVPSNLMCRIYFFGFKTQRRFPFALSYLLNFIRFDHFYWLCWA